MITRIYLIRHGESTYNAEKRFGNSQLTIFGRKQALNAKEKLSPILFKKIFSSDLLRAKQTAEILNSDTHLEIEYLSNLREINLGSWEGILQEDAKHRNPNEFSSFFNTPKKFILEGAEMIKSVQKRGLSAIEHILEQAKGENVLVVSHIVLIQTIITFYEGKSLNQIWEGKDKMKNCSFSGLEFKGNDFVRLLSDEDHNSFRSKGWTRR